MADLTPAEREALALLAGQRRRGAEMKAAVRVEDLKDLLMLPDITSIEESGTITAAKYNALRNDVRAVNAALKAVAGALQGRLR